MDYKKEFFDILPEVTCPAKYTGGELNAFKKDWDKNKVRIALVFPDTYEIGQSGLGLKILYDILNKTPGVLAERFFAPSPDLEEKLRECKLPLLSLESHRPLKNFDLIGFSLQHELTYTNVLNILNLSDIPIESKKRCTSTGCVSTPPLICAGGPSCFNPEPMAEIFDFFVLGDGEDVVQEIASVYKESKGVSKEKILKNISELKGIYVPSFYEVEYETDGKIKEYKPKDSSFPKVIYKRAVTDLNKVDFPIKPVVPYIETIHDRVGIEVFRGCTRGCRFCQAGIIYRPLRERGSKKILDLTESSLKNTGYNELSLVSLNSSDYSQILESINYLHKKYSRQINLSLPSLRVDSFSKELAEQIKTGKLPTLTFAPEAGSQRLRDFINKGTTKEDILKTLKVAKDCGWQGVKLYFMIGLPEETQQDLEAIVDLVREILRETNLRLNLSISPFVPKSWTPFQWYKQEDIEIFKQKIRFLRNRLKYHKLNVRFHSLCMAFVEGVISRGDRRLFKSIYRAWELGAKFDSWKDHFNFNLWLKAFKKTEISPEFYLRERKMYEVLPWDHISPGIEKEFLLNELSRAQKFALTPDCRTDVCSECGVCQNLGVKNCLAEKEDIRFKQQAISLSEQNPFKIRVRFSKGEDLKYISHLDLMRTICRIIIRADLPCAYTLGFTPRIKIDLMWPLSLGAVSVSEYFDLELTKKIPSDEIKIVLNKNMPQGLKILEVKKISLKEKSLMSQICLASYKVKLELKPAQFKRISSKIEKFKKTSEVFIYRKNKKIDLRRLVKDINLAKTNNSKNTLNLELYLTPQRSARLREIFDILGINSSDILNILRTNLCPIGV